MSNASNLVAAFRQELEASSGERSVCAFLRKNPEVILWAFCHGTHANYVLHEFPLGISYKVDFVVLSAYSGMWEVEFVEIEPVTDRIITKGGRPSKRLASAISQLGDWRAYVERNRLSLHRDLSDWCVKKDLLKWSTLNPPMNYTLDRLNDPGIQIRFRYAVVIGRRACITQDGWRKLGQHRSYETTIRTHDVFLDIAENLDRSRTGKDSVLLTETKGDF